MKKSKNAISPAGTVHVVSYKEKVRDGSLRVYSECNYKGWRGDYWGNKWALTDKPVTCKTCLRMLGHIQTFTINREEAMAIRNIVESVKRDTWPFDLKLAQKTVRKWRLNRAAGPILPKL